MLYCFGLKIQSLDLTTAETLHLDSKSRPLYRRTGFYCSWSYLELDFHAFISNISILTEEPTSNAPNLDSKI
jgi:hypothetical protein